MSSKVNFFVDFRFGSLDDKVQSDRVIISNHACTSICYKFGVLGILGFFGLSNI